MRKKILIIDDNENDQKLMDEIIEQSGMSCEVTVAETGEKGIALAKEQNPHLILIDAAMPGMDGFETCKQLKQLEGLNSQVIMITGKLREYDEKKARESGADDYILKLPEPLIETLSKIPQ